MLNEEAAHARMTIMGSDKKKSDVELNTKLFIVRIMSRMVGASPTKNVLCVVRSQCVRACERIGDDEIRLKSKQMYVYIFSSYPQIKKLGKKRKKCLKMN